MEDSEWVGSAEMTERERSAKSILRKVLFETAVGDWMLWAFECVTGFALVELEVLESWQYGTKMPEPVREH